MSTNPTTDSAALPRMACCASLILRSPSELPEHFGEILVALRGAHEWEIVNLRENINGLFTAEYKSTSDPADPSEWQWWADLRNLSLHNFVKFLSLGADRWLARAETVDHGSVEYFTLKKCAWAYRLVLEEWSQVNA